MNLSIVIPLLNEQDSLQELHQRIAQVIAENYVNFTYEVIFVDDGSTDDSWRIVEQLREKYKEVKGIKFRKNYGKAQALNAAFALAEGEVVVTMDADLQDFPEEVPGMYNRLTGEGLDLLSGWKQQRQDPVFTKNIPSKLFNWVARKTSGLKLHDFNCGLKAYKKEVVKTIVLRSDMHRYIPVLANNAGFCKIEEQKVRHTARKHGVSKFGSSRFVNGFLDLITLWFVGRFGNSPMHFFGAMGTLLFMVGFVSALYIGLKKLFIISQGGAAQLVALDPWFYISLTSMIIGAQFFLAGFVGEILVRSKGGEKVYQVEKYLN